LAAVQGVRASDDWWRGHYFNNRDLSGSPVLARDEKAINYDWGGGSPSDEVDSDDFSARWTRTVYLNEGIYRFSATMDDGMRVFVDGALVIDEWRDSQVRTVEIDLPMTAGDHDLEVQYYEAGGQAIAMFSYGPASGPPDTPYDRWEGRYFNNPSLYGPPAFIRADNEIDFNWKAGSPWPTIDNDLFSAYWTGIFQHTPGTYRFTVLTDDGVRLWVNNQLLIDAWHDNQSVTYVAEMTLPGGAVPVRLDYYENEGAALIKYMVEKISGGDSTPAATAVPPQTTLPQDGSAVVVNANWLSVRSTPESGDNVITAAAGGDVVQLLGRYGGWVKVRLPSGVEGWVGGRYLDSRTPLTSLPVLTE
jgi:PA14 domain/Bacterial SH3 domain